MEYQVVNFNCDMKLMRPDGVLVIKKGKQGIVSRKEYQQLTQIYGLAVKGKVNVKYRITKPVEIQLVSKTTEKDIPVVLKKRKGKKR